MAFSVGKWTQKTCERMVEKLFDRTELPFPDNKIEIFTDGNYDYTHVLPDYYVGTCVNYGQLIKIREKESADWYERPGVSQKKDEDWNVQLSCFNSTGIL